LHRHQHPPECVVSVFPVGCLQFCALATGASQRYPRVSHRNHAAPGGRRLRPVWPTHMARGWNGPASTQPDRVPPTPPNALRLPRAQKLASHGQPRGQQVSLKAMRDCSGRAGVCECSTVTHHTQLSCQQGAVDLRTFALTLWHSEPLAQPSTQTQLR
jgi:hypothetical protein